MPYTTSYALNLRGDDGSASRCIRLERFSLPLEGYQLSRQTVSNYTRQCGSVRVPVIGALVSILLTWFQFYPVCGFLLLFWEIRFAHRYLFKIKKFITILLKYRNIHLNFKYFWMEISLWFFILIFWKCYSFIIFIVNILVFYQICFDRDIKDQTR